MRVHIFNPETDYALGCKGGNYNPPASVVRLRKSMALFPATYARPGDGILLLDDFSDEELTLSSHYDLAISKEIKLISLKDFKTLPNSQSQLEGEKLEILPWGWNHSLRNILLRHGISPEMLKSEEDIENIRKLAHRRTTIPFIEKILKSLPELKVWTPKEFSDVEEALAFAEENRGCYFKMPWSSSGRGVICTNGMSQQKLTEWLKGSIAKQGSVMWERGYDRVADFATEWMCENGIATFIGYSWFDTNDTGKYLGNQQLKQRDIRKKIQSYINLDSDKIIDAQKVAIERLIAPLYDGPMGIDMLADREGNVNPCVEINLRMTMGMATILGIRN